MKRVFAGFLLSLLAVSGVYAQSFSRTYNRSLPVAYFEMFGLPPLPAYKLFESESFNSIKTDDGTLTITCESTTEENGIFTGTLLLSVNGMRVMYIRLSLQSDTGGEFNHITAISLTDIVNDDTETIRYDGTLQSGGEIAGAMVELIELFYDWDRLFAP